VACDPYYGFGVNYASFCGGSSTCNVKLTSLLLAHELGHTVGASHDRKRITGFVMGSSFSADVTSFSTNSMDLINRHINRQSLTCVPEITLAGSIAGSSGCTEGASCDLGDGNICAVGQCSSGTCQAITISTCGQRCWADSDCTCGGWCTKVGWKKKQCVC
jgi:hypothetical protein